MLEITALTLPAHDDNQQPRRAAPHDHPAPHHAYATISGWTALTGMGRSVTYEALGRGDLRAVKLGTRTLIDVQHGLRWLDSLPVADIKANRPLPTMTKRPPGQARPQAA